VSQHLFILDTIRNILSNRVKIAAISLDEIVSSKSHLNRNSLNCSTGLLNFSEKDNTYVYKVICSEKDSKTDGHKVSIQLQDDPTEVPDKKELSVKVNCSCPAFLYQGGQFNLSERDALLGNPRGKLVPPKERDPVRVNYGCKHVFAAIRKLLDKFKTETPITEMDLEAPEDKTLIPEEVATPSPFLKEEEIPEEADPESPFKDRIFVDRREVPQVLLPAQVDTTAVEEMEEETVPALKEPPKLFEKEEDENQPKSVFRPRTKLFGKEEDEVLAEEEPELEEEPVSVPSKTPVYQITPKHLDEDDEEDAEDANVLRNKNRLMRENKVKSLFGKETLEA